MQQRRMTNTIYLKGHWEGWVINPIVDGLQIISPGCDELKVEQENLNTVRITEPETSHPLWFDHIARQKERKNESM